VAELAELSTFGVGTDVLPTAASFKLTSSEEVMAESEA